ncbi:MAG: hypothetical protein AAF804_18995, partial [Bacteroidota bacterium]
TQLVQDESDPQEKIEEVLGIYRATEIPQRTQELIEYYFQQATQLSQSLAQRVNFSGIQQYLGVIAKRVV